MQCSSYFQHGGNQQNETFSNRRKATGLKNIQAGFVEFAWGFVHLRAPSDRPLRATWAKTAAPTLLAALLSYGRWSSLNEASFSRLLYLNISFDYVKIKKKTFSGSIPVLFRSFRCHRKFREKKRGMLQSDVYTFHRIINILWKSCYKEVSGYKINQKKGVIGNFQQL